MLFSERKLVEECGSNLVLYYNIWLILDGECDGMVIKLIASYEFFVVFTVW